MKTRARAAVLCPAFLLLVTTAGIADWPQWRGPNRDGKSTDTGLLDTWPEGGPPLVLQAEGLGRGFSSVSVAGGRLFTLGDFGDTQFALALDASDGQILWRTAIGPSWADGASIQAPAPRRRATAIASTCSAPRAGSPASTAGRGKSSGAGACPRTSAASS